MGEVVVITFRAVLVLTCWKTCFTKSFSQSLETGEGKIDLSHFGLRIFGNPIENDQKSWNENEGNMEELGPYLEGDLLIPLQSRNGMKSESLRWKNGEVPFEIRGSFSKLIEI